jgi:glycosyltransferase involved in cell wall biosynthesis
MTRISFLMPTYNRAHFIGEALGAILSQAESCDEILVIDDGSTDDTAAVVAPFGDRVRYVRQDNAGKSVALNRAMALTDGEFVWICDDDDLLRADVVAPMLAAIEQDGAGFAFGRYTRFREDPGGARVDLGTGYWPDLTEGTLVRHILEDAFVMQNAALVRRSSYGVVGPFDEKMLRSLDYDMFVRLALHCRPRYVDAIIFDQRKHEGARGPARALHAAAQSDKVWVEYDRRIFERAYEAVPLNRYEAMFAGEDPALLRRAALLQRACVSGRHDMWPQAAQDLEAAVREAPALPFQPAEIAICGRMLGGKHGFGGALAPEILARLQALRSADARGAALIDHMLEGAMWRLWRDRDVNRAEMRRLVLNLAGYQGAGRLLLRRLGRKRGEGCPSTRPLLVRERTER